MCSDHVEHGSHAGKFASAQKLMELVQHTESDAWLALRLASHLSLLPLSRQLSCLSGSLWSRTLQARPLCFCQQHPCMHVPALAAHAAGAAALLCQHTDACMRPCTLRGCMAAESLSLALCISCAVLLERLFPPKPHVPPLVSVLQDCRKGP
jgi:hypothetical protein